MSPEVVPFKELENQPEYFTIDLESNVPLDPNLFDMQAKLLGAGQYNNLKYIVVKNTLFGFDFFTSHGEFYRILKKSGNNGILQSAGMITVDIEHTGKRTITDYSSTLESLLSKEDSNAYKMTVLKEKLGKYFSIEIAPLAKL